MPLSLYRKLRKKSIEKEQWYITASVLFLAFSRPNPKIFQKVLLRDTVRSADLYCFDFTSLDQAIAGLGANSQKFTHFVDGQKIGKLRDLLRGRIAA